MNTKLKPGGTKTNNFRRVIISLLFIPLVFLSNCSKVVNKPILPTNNLSDPAPSNTVVVEKPISDS
jgi:hypothetical protein